MKTRILNIISIFLLMLVTGVFWGTWFTLTRSIDEFTLPEFIHIGKVIIANVGMPMRILMPACILFMFLSMWFYPEKKFVGFYFNVAAFVLIVVTLLITLTVLVPIDNQIKMWTETNAPVNWETIRARWQWFHALRTFTSVMTFACFAIAVIRSKN